MSTHGTSPEFERKLQEIAAKTAHMVIPRSEVQAPITILEAAAPHMQTCSMRHWVDAPEDDS